MKRFMDWVSDRFDKYVEWSADLREPWGFLSIIAPMLICLAVACAMLAAFASLAGDPWAYPVRIVK